MVRFLGRRGHRLSRGLHLGRRCRQPADKLADPVLEVACQAVHGPVLLDERPLFVLDLLGFETRLRDGVILEDVDRVGHGADLVLTAEAGHAHGMVAAGQALHGFRHAPDRAGDRVRE
jgi:hypothetical protein